MSRRLTAKFWVRVAGSLIVALGMGGCAEPIFAPHQSRTQYDRYDRLRNQYAPQFVQDDLGRRTPNIRARLTPKQ